jgi:hypothetical protein
VFFRDTAHGFVMWAVAAVIAAALFSGTIAAIAGRSGQAALAMDSAQNSAYALDSLFRSDRPGADTTVDLRPEANRILANGISNGALAEADRTYLAKMVESRSGGTFEGAQKRVDSVFVEARAADVKVRQAVDTARKRAATASLFTALSMLVGAFIACTAAALGGQHRDMHP